MTSQCQNCINEAGSDGLCGICRGKLSAPTEHTIMTREQWEAHRSSRGSYFVSYQHYLDATNGRVQA